MEWAAIITAFLGGVSSVLIAYADLVSKQGELAKRLDKLETDNIKNRAILKVWLEWLEGGLRTKNSDGYAFVPPLPRDLKKDLDTLREED